MLKKFDKNGNCIGFEQKDYSNGRPSTVNQLMNEIQTLKHQRQKLIDCVNKAETCTNIKQVKSLIKTLKQ